MTKLTTFEEVRDYAFALYLGQTEEPKKDFTVSDILLVSMLYPKVPPDYRVQGSTTFSILYNRFAETKEKEATRYAKDPMG